MPYRVIVGLPRWEINSSSIFAERLVRGLLTHGHEATLLLTESSSTISKKEGATLQGTFPSVPCEILAVGEQDTWGQRWEALERYLEERAPCHYLMLHAWRSNAITPRLSNRIHLVGVVLNDGELQINQAQRLFPYWNAMVAGNECIHFKLTCLMHSQHSRIVRIPEGVSLLSSSPVKLPGDLQIAYITPSSVTPEALNVLTTLVSKLEARTHQFHLNIISSAPSLGMQDNQFQRLMHQGLISIAGSMANTDLLATLENHHALLSIATDSEDLPLSLLEGMSRGCIPLLPYMGSRARLFDHGTNALTSAAGNLDAFVAQVETLICDPEQRQRLGENAFTTVSSAGLGIERMVERYLQLFVRIEEHSQRRDFVRPRKPYVALQEKVAGQSIFSESTITDQHYISATDRWPDPPALIETRTNASSLPSESIPLEKHRVLVACSGGSISGVDTFSVHLVRGLRQRGIDARILTRPADQDGNPISFADDIPLELKDPRLESDYLSWKIRWQIMREHLENLSPCIYLPNYDDRYSCLAPVLSNRVRVIGIAHSDDPWHYEHLCRIGHACNALVGVSHAITDHLRGLAPAFGSRLHTIPYGIPFPSALKPAWDEDVSALGRPRLRIIYTGRLIPRQKRVLDLLAIAQALDERRVPYEMIIVGDGDLRYSMERQAHQLVRERKIWFTGAQPHEDGLAILAMADVFLLPSSFEGLSVGMLEAMALGLVPVVSDLRSGVPDVIVPGCNGLVARVGDCEGFADHLQWLCHHPEERRRMGQAAAGTVNSNYLINPMIERYISLFQKVVSAPYSRPSGAIIPPAHILPELKLSTWAARIAADPGQSVNRVMKRLF